MVLDALWRQDSREARILVVAGRNKPIPDNVVSIDGTKLTVIELDKANRRRITAAAKERYLILLKEGLDPSEAARSLGLTGSRMRSEAKRDKEFGQKVEQARAEGVPGVADRVFEMYQRRALDPDGPPQLLHNLAVAIHPLFEPFRRTKLEGSLGLQPLPQIDASLYTDEELIALRELLNRKAIEP